MNRLIQHDPSPAFPTRESLLQALQESQTQIVGLLESMAYAQDWQPEPAEWSFRLIAAHLATVEQNWHLPRLQAIASGRTPHFAPYINSNLGLARADLHDSLQQWVAARRRLAAYVRELSEAQLAYAGIHPVVGTMTVPDTLQEIWEQDQGILRHIYQLIVAYHEEALQTHRV